MELEYKAYRERRSHRIKIATIFLICWIIYIALGVWIYYIHTKVFGIFFIIGLLGFFVSLAQVGSRYWISDPNEKTIFKDLYRSSELIELCSENNYEESKLYRGKAVAHVKDAIWEIDDMCKTENINSILFEEEFASRLERLANNLKHRILPRIVEGKDLTETISVLHGLTKFFGEIGHPMSLDELDSINENLETYGEMPFTEREIKPMFKKALISKPSQLAVSIFLGYFSVTAIFWVFSQLLTIDFVEFMRSNLVGVVSVGAVLSGIIAGIFVLKK